MAQSVKRADDVMAAVRREAVVSNCSCQVVKVAHFCRFSHSAFAMVASFLATAVMIALCGLPALRM